MAGEDPDGGCGSRANSQELTMEKKLLVYQGIMTFSTGRTITPYNGTIGINKDMEVSEGYDNMLTEKSHPIMRIEDDPEERTYVYTAEERKELAEYMIDLWKKFAE